MKTATEPSATPAQIRQAFSEDPSRVSDAGLLALVVGVGAQRNQGRGRIQSWSSVALAEELYERAGGRLPNLVNAILTGYIDFREYGIGVTLGSRLMAAMELARRFSEGFAGGGDATIRADSGLGGARVATLVLELVRSVSEGELVVALLDESFWSHDGAQALLACFESPQAMMESLSLDAFGSALDSSHLRLPESDVELRIERFFRLLAAIELAWRHRARTALRRRRLESGRCGLTRLDLVRLLDPLDPLERPLREKLSQVLRTHPAFADALAGLDALARARSYADAVEAHQMLEVLLESEWVDPASVLGPQEPFGALLCLVEVKIERAAGPSERLEEVRRLLVAAEVEAIAKPVASFVAALRELRISDHGARTAFEEAVRHYFEDRDGGDRR